MTHRVTFALRLPRENVDEYTRRHARLWPELSDAITRQGGSNFSIFAIPELDHVVGYLEVEDRAAWDAGEASDITRRWWHYMADIMPTHDDDSPLSTPIFEVFHHA